MTDTGEPDSVTAVLDEAHVGDIKGAFGTIRHHDTDARRSWRARILTLLAIMGPGLIVMVGDNDAGGVSTYAQAGQNFGLTLLWTLPLLIPVLIVNQEMVVRLGAVTGVGHARLINERFGRFWGAFSVGDLFILNFLTIATEFIGVSLALGYFGVSEYISVPIAAVALVVMTATGSFRRWERFMFVFVFANLLVIPLAVQSHPPASSFFHGLLVPGVQGGFDSTSVLLVIAIVGTTVAPWQLFFQQSNIVDKRITPRWINYERTDTVIGSFVTVFAACLLMAVVAAAFAHTSLAGHYTNAGGVAARPAALRGQRGRDDVRRDPAQRIADRCRVGDPGHLLRVWRRLRHAPLAAPLVARGQGLLRDLLTDGGPGGRHRDHPRGATGRHHHRGPGPGRDPAPGATVFLLLLCNDKEVLGPWVNRPWLNVVAGIIVSILLMLSLVLMATTVFTQIDVTALALGLGAVLLVAYAVVGVYLVATRRTRAPVEPMSPERRANWRMPPLNLLNRPKWSRGRVVGMYALRVYLVAAVVLLLVKAIELGVNGKG